MTVQSSWVVGLVAALVIHASVFANEPASDPQHDFLDPPETAQPGVWWHWMGCNVTAEGITRDLEAFKDAGIGAATIFGMADTCTPRAGAIANSPTDGLIAFTDPWWKLVAFAAEEAKRLGLDLGLHNCPGYTHSGGPWITPELSMQEICFSQTPVEGGRRWRGTLPRPQVDPRANAPYPVLNKDTGVVEKPIIEGRITYYRDIAVLALPAEGVASKEQIQDLTPRLHADGSLEWDAPPGNWILYRFGHTTMGSYTQPNQWEAFGLESDKMSVEATEFHLRHVLGEMKKHLGDLVGTGLRHILFDSYEAGTPSWTPKMPQEFATRRGYDLTPFMATFAGRVVFSERDTRRFRGDFSRTIADLYRDAHFATVARMVAEAGLEFQSEPYGGPFHTEEVAPYVQRVMTEFWTGTQPSVRPEIYNAGDGKRHNILEAEAFTGRPQRSRWDEYPGGLKMVGDGAFSAGINRLFLHAAPHQPWDDRYRPGMTMGQWGTHFGRTQTWWEPGKAWIAYLQRCQALLQWGEPGATNSFTSAEPGALRALHRRTDRYDVFFVSNQTNLPVTASCSFKVTGRQPELWDPVTGAMRELPQFQAENGETTLTLEFAPVQSWFVVFRNEPAGELPGQNFPARRPVAELSGAWEVTFDPTWGGPEQAVTFESLTDWTHHAEAGIKYYSGTAVYRKTFDAPIPATELDLGDFSHLARVRLNGQDLGVVWCAPYRVVIPTGLLKRAGNALEIEITNVWANRLIGDEREPPDAGDTRGQLVRFPDWFVNNEPRPSQGRYTFTTWNYFSANSSLIPSGLLGPVTLRAK